MRGALVALAALAFAVSVAAVGIYMVLVPIKTAIDSALGQ